MTISTANSQEQPRRQSRTHKLLVIGIDGGTWDIVLPMAADGKLPNLQRLMQTGAYGTLHSTIPPVTAPAWSSFITGTNPGRHGIFHFYKREKDDHGSGGRTVLANSQHIRGIPFWKVLNTHEKKVGLINIPLTYPPQKVNGFMVSGMLVPAGSKDYTYPPELAARLDNYHVDLDGLMVDDKWGTEALVERDRTRFIRNVYTLSQARAQNALTLMKNEAWDLFMVVFTGSDRICHFFWEDTASQTPISSAVQEYYIMLDALIGKLVQEAGESTLKIVMSDHGFGPAPKKSVNIFTLAKVLDANMRSLTFWSRYLKNRFLSKMGIVPKKAVIELVMLEEFKILLMPMYANFLGIHIKHSNGELIKRRLCDKLETLYDPASRTKMVEKILARDVLFQGPFADKAPDLVVQFSYDYQLQFDPRGNRLISDIRPRTKTGEHRIEGLLIACGPQIEPGQLKGPVWIQDVTPTLLYALNSAIPKNYDGRLISELFRSDYLTLNEPRYGEMQETPGVGEDKLAVGSPEEFEKAKELLKGLGYL